MNDNLRDFAEIITDLRDGAVHHELSRAILEVTRKVQDTGKVGSVQLTLKIKPSGSFQVEVTDIIKKVVPERTKPSTCMFIDKRANLVRDNPYQQNVFELKDAVKKEVEVRDAGNGQ